MTKIARFAYQYYIFIDSGNCSQQPTHTFCQTHGQIQTFIFAVCVAKTIKLKITFLHHILYLSSLRQFPFFPQKFNHHYWLLLSLLLQQLTSYSSRHHRIFSMLFHNASSFHIFQSKRTNKQEFDESNVYLQLPFRLLQNPQKNLHQKFS